MSKIANLMIVVVPLLAGIMLALTQLTAGTEAALAGGAPQKTLMGREVDVYTVIFEFNVQPHQQEELSEKIQQLVDNIVSEQPGFVSANLHLSTDGEKVLNYFQWESEEAFAAFRNNEEAMSQIQPVIGPYGPQPRVYDIVYSVIEDRAAVHKNAK